MLRCDVSFALLINSGDSLKLVGVMRTSGSTSGQHIRSIRGAAPKICAVQFSNAASAREGKNYPRLVFQQVSMLPSAPGAGLSILQDVSSGLCKIGSPYRRKRRPLLRIRFDDPLHPFDHTT